MFSFKSYCLPNPINPINPIQKLPCLSLPKKIHSHPTGSGKDETKKGLEVGQASSQEEDENDLNLPAEVIFHPGPDL
jgi:hypothetical protein